MARTYTADKGTQVMLGMLLSQYKNSPNLIQYISAFTDEMNELFEAIERVYFGRLFEDAEGEQLNIIGRLVDLNRNINIAKVQFGFDTEPSSLGFGDATDPAQGGIFRSEEDGGFTVAPLDDETYKRALRARFLLLNEQTPNINLIYKVICTLLDRVPSTISLAEVASNDIELTLASLDTATDEVVLINHMSKWFTKAGSQFDIILI